MPLELPHQTVLLLGNDRPTLTIARQLARRGANVIVGREGCDHGAELSRYVSSIWDHPPLADDRRAFNSALEAFLDRHRRIRIVMPVAEEFVRALAETPPALPDTVTLASLDPALLEVCLDKYRMMELAEQLGLPIAPHALVRDPHELGEQGDKVGFPMVVRPVISAQRIGVEKAVIVSDRDALLAQFSDWQEERGGLILQRQATGNRHNIYFAARHGEIRRLLHTRILRTDRADGSGLAVEGVTVDPGEDLVRHMTTLVDHLNYDGIGCAQFLIDDDTGEICFLENNPRVSGSHAIPEHCGLDLTEFLLALAQGRDAELGARPFAAGGVRYSWTVGDLIGLKTTLRGRKIGLLGALRWTARIALTALRSQVDMVNRWDDPMPALGGFADAMPLIGRLTRRRHTRRPATAHADADTQRPASELRWG